jgi:nucleotide-binding universal stress UspA family protein
MERILALTDFSALSKNALSYAAALAIKTGAELELLNVYEWPMVYNDRTPEVLPIYLPAEEIREASEKNLAAAKQELELQYPGVIISTSCRPSMKISDEVNTLSKQQDYCAIVAGVHEAHGIESWFADTALSLIKQSKYNVIGVPAGYREPRFTKAVLATDLSPLNDRTANGLITMMKKIGCELEVVHIQSPGSNKQALPDKLLQTLTTLDPAFKTIESDDLKESLKTYLSETPADMLVVLPHHHNLWESLFSKTHTKEIVVAMPVPVITIPEK